MKQSLVGIFLLHLQPLKSFTRISLSTLFILLFTVAAHSATISGTLFQSDGTTPVTGTTSTVTLYSSPHCNSKKRVETVEVSPADGSYYFDNITAGTYLLEAEVTDANLISEWWAGDQSSPQCIPRSLLSVADEEVATEKNFQLSVGSTISGTVFIEDGTTPLSSSTGRVHVYSGNNCESKQYVGTTTTNSSDGTYTVDKLAPGSYYLKAKESDSNYVSEWWDDGGSKHDCSQIAPITVGDAESVTNKNFQLDVGAIISGWVYESDGVTPISYEGSSYVYLHKDDPCREYPIISTYPYIIRESPFADASVDEEDGSYTINKIPPGTYYLSTNTFYENYVDEWWALPESKIGCSNAAPITVAQAEVVPGKNFQLDTGAVLVGTIYDGETNSPITGKTINISVFSGNPCGYPQPVGDNYVDSVTGTFRVEQLPAGSYFLLAEPSTGNYINEWWAPAKSIPECDAAQTIDVAVGETVSNINFQLNSGSTLSGTIYKNNASTPILDTVMYVRAYSGHPCGEKTLVRSGDIDKSTGQYSVEGLMPGNYYLRADDDHQTSGVEIGPGYGGGSSGGYVKIDDYVNEWWASAASSSDCAYAEPVSIVLQEPLSALNFHLNDVSKLAGDVTLDGLISLEDAVLCLQLLTGYNNHTVWIYGDTDYDGTVDVQDVIYILKKIVQN